MARKGRSDHFKPQDSARRARGRGEAGHGVQGSARQRRSTTRTSPTQREGRWRTWAPSERRRTRRGALDPATGLLKTRPLMERRPRRSLCRPGSRCEAWQDGRHLRAAQRGPRLMEGQPITRAALQRSCCVVRGDCARGHGGACGAAEHSRLDRLV